MRGIYAFSPAFNTLGVISVSSDYGKLQLWVNVWRVLLGGCCIEDAQRNLKPSLAKE
jgi:hypothetical protein